MRLERVAEEHPIGGTMNATNLEKRFPLRFAEESTNFAGQIASRPTRRIPSCDLGLACA